jgi:hypothetical protein
MELKKLHAFFVEQGIRKDPRGQEAVKKELKNKQAAFDKLSEDEKAFFDMDSLTNPYLDSRILNGTGKEDIKTVIIGVDMEVSEVLLANTLKAQGQQIDLILTHHPEGTAYATFYEVMSMQADIFNKYGVPINIAESLTETRKKEVGRRVMPQNHQRAVDAAKLLNFPFMSAHTVADNHVTTFLQELFDTKKPEKLDDIVKLLRQIPEYADAAKHGAGPKILIGAKDSRPGRIFVDMTGGTEPSKDLLEKMADSGIGTVIAMHMSEDHIKLAEKNNLRVIIAGHISSDNLGLNLLFDAAEKEFGKMNFIECSGFRRFRRN